MISLSLTREPVLVRLTGAFAGVTVTLRRLTTPQFNNCQNRALALLRDPEALLTILHRNELAGGRDMKRAFSDPAFAAGFGAWLGAVECGIEAIDAWTGIALEGGAPAPLARDRTRIAGVAEPADPRDLTARLSMEALFLDKGFDDQLSREITQAARLLATEGKSSGLSETGKAGAAPTAGGPHGARAASKPAKRARPGGATARAANVRATKTPPRPPKG